MNVDRHEQQDIGFGGRIAAFFGHSMCGAFLACVGLSIVEVLAAGDSRCSDDRSQTDLPDDRHGPQVHLLYLVPSDGADRHLDTNGDICRSVASLNAWLHWKSDGYRLILDTHRSSLDVTFVELDRTAEQFRQHGRGILHALERSVKRRIVVRPEKIYLAYYDGTSIGACGGGGLPPLVSSQLAAVYLRGTAQDGSHCDRNELTRSVSSPSYWEFALLHEVIHTLGYVASCAPHYSSNGHVFDSPNDLMYSGREHWRPSFLDYGRDDYFGHNLRGCPDLRDSPFLETVKKKRPSPLRASGWSPSALLTSGF